MQAPPTNPTNPAKPVRRNQGRPLEHKRGHCRCCGILPEIKGALYCSDCAQRAPLITYHVPMGDDRYTLRTRVAFQLAGDDDDHSRYVCSQCLGPKGYHGKICRSCASRNNRGNPRFAARKEHLQ